MSGILQTLFLGAAAAVKDAYFNLVTLLLNTTATNGAQNNTFLDSSTNNFSITRNGNTTQGTFTPFSQTGWSNNFVRSGSQFFSISNSTGDFNFGTGALTIECWVNLSSMPTGSGYPTSYWLFGGGPLNSDPGIDLYITSTQIGFNLVDFVSPTVIGNHGMSVGNWYHVVVVRGGTSNQTVSIYVNGTRIATASSVTASAATTANIAISAAEPVGSTGGNLDGYISNYRVVKGSAVYDPTLSTLTVPTTPLISITNTVLLTCQSNRFVDNSGNNFAITINGTPSVQAFSPFAPAYITPTTYSGFFGSTTGKLSVASMTALGSDFTIECWIFPTSFADYNTIWDNRTSDSDANGCALGLTAANKAYFYTNSNFQLTTTTALTENAWTHLALVRNGSGSGNVKIYINGVADATTATYTTSFTGTAASIACDWNTRSNLQFFGCISNFRTLTTALYTTNFTPPTSPLTAIANTTLLTCQSSTFIDNSGNNFAITASGNAKPVASPTPFAPTVETEAAAYSTTLVGGSGYFDGSGDYLATGTATALDNISGDFTIEYWQYPLTGGSALSPVLGSANGGFSGTASFFAFEEGSNKLLMFLNATQASSLISYTAPTKLINNWAHVAWVRSGSVITLYLNGAVAATVTYTNTISLNTTNSNTYIGRNGWDSYYWLGYISSLRVVKGTAVYTSAFTPPAAPATAVTNTQLLLNYTNAGIYDSAAKNDLETVGNAQVSTAQAKFGTTSMYFDGTGDWLYRPYSALFPFGTGDFTIEWFMNPDASQNNFSGIFNFQSGSTYFIAHNNLTSYPNLITVFVDTYSPGTRVLTGTTTLSSGTWYHVAITRASGTWRLFVNGSLEGSTYSNSAEPVPSNGNLYIGQGNAVGYKGYIDEFRITKGYARYTANFTPPAAAFPIQ